MSNGKKDDPKNILGGRFPPKELQKIYKKKRESCNILPFIWFHFISFCIKKIQFEIQTPKPGTKVNKEVIICLTKLSFPSQNNS